MKLKRRLLTIYKRLLDDHGHRNWWPGKTRLEIAVGAILTQNTNWQNAARAISELKRAKLLSLNKLRQTSHAKLAKSIYSSGYYNQKAIKIKCFVDFMYSEFNGDFGRMAKTPLFPLREKLLTVKGVGKETADSILLYALNKPIFVVDAYTNRIFRRLGMVDDSLPREMQKAYDGLQQLFMQNLPHETALFNDYHAQIVRLGHMFCLKTNPKCQTCPLKRSCSYANDRPKTTVKSLI